MFQKNSRNSEMDCKTMDTKLMQAMANIDKLACRCLKQMNLRFVITLVEFIEAELKCLERWISMLLYFIIV